MRVDLTRLDDLVHFDDGDACSFGETWIEVLAAAAEFAIAESVGPIGAHEGVVNADGWFEQERLAVEKAHFLGFGNWRAHAGRRKDAGQACAASAQSLDECALRHDLE